MDFFKSVFSDPDPDPENSPSHSPQNPRNEEIAGTDIADETVGSWKFGGFIETIGAKSESLIQACRRNFEEFSSGIKKETAAIRDAAARVVLDLPASLATGAFVAQESLETIGQVVDDFSGSIWCGTADILCHGNDASLSIDSDGDDSSPSELNPKEASLKRYSGFEARVLAIQSDPRTFREEPEDLEDFSKWKEGFLVEEKKDEIKGLLDESSALEGFLETMVPSVVDYETFWSRYFYRFHKLKQVEDARTNLVLRVIAGDEDEDLSWEVVDDDEDDEDDDGKKENSDAVNNQSVGNSESLQENDLVKSLKAKNFDDDGKREESETVSDGNVGKGESLQEKEIVESSEIENFDAEVENAVPESEETMSKFSDQVNLESKGQARDSSKDSDLSVSLKQPLILAEDELEWDQIEDLGEHEDTKWYGLGCSPNRLDLLKRMMT